LQKNVKKCTNTFYLQRNVNTYTNTFFFANSFTNTFFLQIYSRLRKNHISFPQLWEYCNIAFMITYIEKGSFSEKSSRHEWNWKQQQKMNSIILFFITYCQLYHCTSSSREQQQTKSNFKSINYFGMISFLFSHWISPDFPGLGAFPAASSKRRKTKKHLGIFFEAHKFDKGKK